MKKTSVIIALAAAAVFTAAGYGLYRIGVHQGAEMAGTGLRTEKPPQAAMPVDPGTDRKVLYWHDPMVPGQKFDKPGKSPFMDMPLVPVYADAHSDTGAVTISPRVQQSLGVRTAEVTTGSLAQKLEVPGSVAYNERDVAVVTARVAGYVERLYVRAQLDPVRVGQPLAEIFAPDWVATQEEYLSVRRMQGPGTEALLSAARQRMLLAGMTEDQVRLVETTAKVEPRFTLRAPMGGVITELGAREGMTVMAGAVLFRINGLGSVWIYAEVPEGAAARIRPASSVEARTASLPDRVFKGRVAAILPEVNAATRTLKARVEVANVGGLLVPGMFASVNFMPAAGPAVLLVPSEAVIQTGRRKVVIAALEGGKFQPLEVETGAEANGQTEIRKGLSAGQKVVISGQFLVDSEASLKATTTRMSEPPPQSPGAQLYRGTAKVESIEKETIALSHDPIPALQWGAMTMDFRLPAGGLPKEIKKGDSVTFAFTQDKDGKFKITSIARATAKPAQAAK